MEKPRERKRQNRLATILLWVVSGGLVVVGLLLPPVSLGKRLFQSDYETLDAENPSVSYVDGLTLKMDPAAAATG